MLASEGVGYDLNRLFANSCDVSGAGAGVAARGATAGRPPVAAGVAAEPPLAGALWKCTILRHFE